MRSYWVSSDRLRTNIDKELAWRDKCKTTHKSEQSLVKVVQLKDYEQVERRSKALQMAVKHFMTICNCKDGIKCDNCVTLSKIFETVKGDI